jgi:hypothetical protein
MLSKRIRGAVLASSLSAFVTLGAGCYAEAEGTIPTPENSYGYAPVYYDGYVVYYDDVGRPYYHVGGARVWVPQNSRGYSGYATHWRTFGPRYHEWYSHSGNRYQGYRFHGHRR